MNKKSALGIILGLLFLISLSTFLSLTVGSVLGYDHEVFWLIRMPRTLACISIGGGLAVAGLIAQAAMANPLADSFTLGVASAGAFGAVLGSVFFGSTGFLSLSSGVLAFLCAFLVLLGMVFWLRNRFRSSVEILLVGVMVGTFFSSLATLLLAVADPAAWVSANSWLMGSIRFLDPYQAILVFLSIFFIVFITWLHWKPLDILATGDLVAETVGVDTAHFRKRFFIMVALITAICVSTAGIIGFVGLLVPHLLRALGVFKHRLLIPASYLGGASLLLFSDITARIIIRPSELPVGVVMAVIGAPLFLFLLKRKLT